MARSDSQKKYPAMRAITVTGNMTREPKEIRGKSGSGDAITGAGFGVALNSVTYDGFEDSMFLDVTLWGFWADAVLDNYEKGERVRITGDLYLDEYDGKRTYKFDATEIAKIVYPKRDDNAGGRGGSSRRSSSRDGDDEERGSGRSSSRRSSRSTDEEERESTRGSSRRSSRSSESDDDAAEAPRGGRRTSSRRRADDGDDIDD